MTKTGKLGLMVGAATIAMMSSAMAQATNADMAARIQALEDRLDAATERAIADRTRLSTLEQQYNYASWTFDNGRPVLSSGDGRFTMGVRLRFQSDFAGFSQDDTHPAGFSGPADLSSGAVVRRAYFGVEGKVYNDFAYEIRLNAGGSNGGSSSNAANAVVAAGEGDPLLNKAQLTYTGIPDWHFSVGILEPALMAEGTDSSASLMFMERPEIENIAADSFGAGDSRRGVEIGWSRTDAIWAGDNLAITTAFTGGKTGAAANHGTNNAPALGDGDEQSQILGRISDRLWTNGISNIQVGVSAAKILYSGSNGNPQGGAQTINFQERPQIRVDGTRLISTGGIAAKTGDMIAFDMEGNLDNFYLGGEWAQFSADRQCGTLVYTGGACATANGGSATTVVDHPTFSGWFVEGTWIITGETKPYTPSAINNEVGGFGNPVPSRPFSLAGDSWGAWELAVRYASTNLNWNSNVLTNNLATSTLAGIAGGKEDIVTLGVNWYLNRNVKFTVNDMIVSVKKGTLALPTRDSQDLNIVGVRLQFAN